MGRKFLRRLLRILGISVAVLVLFGFITYLVLNKSLPEGKAGPEADALAEKMLKAVNYEAWEELNAIRWRFPRGHYFVWDRKRNLVEVKWGENRVLIAPDEGRGIAYTGEVRQEGETEDELVQEALKLFWNDSFWLAAYTKVMDPGTTRQIVELDEGGQGLLVTYSSGGVTPGDSYLWTLDETGLPKSWEMWVNIIPIGGLEFSWEAWEPLHNGALLAHNHSSFVFDIFLTEIQSGDDLSSIGASAQLFDELLAELH